MQKPTETLTQALAVTAECCGTELSLAAARIMSADLAEYPQDAVLKALAKVRREHQGRLTLAAITTRIDDGRPGPDEAWAMIPHDEYTTAMMTTEMQMALAIASPVMNEPVAARMAFREAYKREVEESRVRRKPVEWRVSLGWDQAGRVDVLAEAVQLGRITENHALQFLNDQQTARFQQSLGKHTEAIADNVKAALSFVKTV